jgi:hypothetical protein
MERQKTPQPETPREKRTLRHAIRPIVVWIDRATGGLMRKKARAELDLHLERSEEAEKKNTY